MIYKMANMIVRSPAAVQVLIRDATDNIWWRILIFLSAMADECTLKMVSNEL